MADDAVIRVLWLGKNKSISSSRSTPTELLFKSCISSERTSFLNIYRSNLTPQTVMLGGIPPSIQHGRKLWAKNSPLPFMIGEWFWGVLVYTDIEEYTRICLVRNHSLWSGPMTEFHVRGITGWCWMESFPTQRGCWVEIWMMLGGNCMGK